MHHEHDAAAPVRILARRTALRQALRHVVDNALEACREMPPGHRVVEVRIEPPARGEVVVIVSDTGPGFSADSPQRLFEPLFSTKPGRLGMGLAVSRSVFEEHGGRVRAQRGDDGRTRVFVTLPLEPANP